MAIELKCPKCSERLVYWGATGALLRCPQCEFGWGNEELWLELIQTKKELEIAIKGIKTLGEYDPYKEHLGIDTIAQNILEQIGHKE